MTERYSVYYTSNAALGSIQERECHLVPFEEALKWFHHHTRNVASMTGLTACVIMTDGGDMIVAEWTYESGLIWPKEEDRNG